MEWRQWYLVGLNAEAQCGEALVPQGSVLTGLAYPEKCYVSAKHLSEVRAWADCMEAVGARPAPQESAPHSSYSVALVGLSRSRVGVSTLHSQPERLRWCALLLQDSQPPHLGI